MKNEVWRQKLLAMRARDERVRDERVRDELARSGELFEGYAPRMEAIHRQNAAELETMLKENRAWLGRTLVGEEGAEAAWIIVQHAISNPELSRHALELLREAVFCDEAAPRHVAFLHDRICFFEGVPQRYGTQSDWNEAGEMAIWTLEDGAQVNFWRAGVGLPSLEKRVWKSEEAREQPPSDWAQRQARFEAWARSVGWRI